MKPLDKYKLSEDFISNFWSHWHKIVNIVSWWSWTRRNRIFVKIKNPYKEILKINQCLTVYVCLYFADWGRSRKKLFFCLTTLVKHFLFLSGTNIIGKPYERNLGDWWCWIYNNYLFKNSFFVFSGASLRPVKKA